MSLGIVTSNCFKKLLTLARAGPLITTELEKNEERGFKEKCQRLMKYSFSHLTLNYQVSYAFTVQPYAKGFYMLFILTKYS